MDSYDKFTAGADSPAVKVANVLRHKSLYYDCHSCPDFHRDKLQQESIKTEPGYRIKHGKTCQPKVKKSWTHYTNGKNLYLRIFLMALMNLRLSSILPTVTLTKVG
jgi:hypothetical protein